MVDELESWREEKRSAYVYSILSAVEKNPVHKKLFLGLSEVANHQAAIWEKQIQKTGNSLQEYHPDLRTRFIVWLLRRLGAKYLRTLLAAMKVRGMSVYHSQALHYSTNTVFPEMEHKHHGLKAAGNLRAAIFGVSDGLLSNASLVFGVAGAAVSSHFILLSGIAGLLAGAFSMGAGEYISVNSQRQMLEYQLELERKELEIYPEEEAAELSLIYQARGLTKEEADKLSFLLIKNPEKALDTLAREELGLNPDELGSPWGAAFSSFFSFTFGAVIPLLPFIFLEHSSFNLFFSIALTAFTFFGVGAMLSLFTQRSALRGGLRLLAIGAAIGLLTYSIGSLFNI